MPKKSKGEKIELLYSNKKENKKTSTQKKKVTTNKGRKNKATNNNIIDFDNEIIIGLTPKKDNVNNKNKKKSVSPKKNTNVNSKTQKKTVKKKKNKKTVKKALLKWTILMILVLTAIILFLLSDVFNIKKIEVENNSKISSEEIIRLSGLLIDENMFKVFNKKIKENIKSNAYIENVKINKKINGTINIYVEERKPNYMLQYENYYAYINSQGYILEISDIKLELPMISGYKTPLENIQAGNRLNNDDLETFGVIIKIMQAAQSKGLKEKITHIDIADEKNYILKMESEGKTIHFGDSTNINEKMLWIVKLLEEEKEFAGEIFVKDLKKIYFREEV